MPTTRRSKSFSRPHDAGIIPRTGSPLQDPAKDGAASRSSRSRKPSVDNAMIGVSPRRSSMEKARAMKMFTNGRASGETATDGSIAHRKTDSVASDSFRTLSGASPEYGTDYEVSTIGVFAGGT